MTELSGMTWPRVEVRHPVLAVPLGATEQHGPHLPLGTDTLVAAALCRELADRREDVVVAPALPYGSSGEHAGFPGTLSIGQQVLEELVVELVRSAGHFCGVVLVSGHGGNAEPLARAVDRLQGEGRPVLAWSPRPSALGSSALGPVPPAGSSSDVHAGRIETSLVAFLRPDLVDAAAASGPRPAPVPLRELMPTLRRHGVRAVAPDGVLGDPRGAGPEEGRALLAALADDLERSVAEWVAGGAASSGAAADAIGQPA